MCWLFPQKKTYYCNNSTNFGSLSSVFLQKPLRIICATPNRSLIGAAHATCNIPTRTETDINATAGWQSVGVNLVAGDRVTVEYVSGQAVDADGYPGVAPRKLQGPCAAAPLPAETHAALIGRVATGRAFLIGKHRAFPVDRAGALELRMNGADACAGDSRGSIRVRISRSPAVAPTP